MKQQVIVTDSTSDLTHQYLAEHQIHVVPLNLTIDGKSYVDQVDISSEEYINRIEDEADVKTSQPSIENLSINMKNWVNKVFKLLVYTCHLD